MRSSLLAAALSVATALPLAAAPVGQPFLVMEDDLGGSILDFFGDFGPSGVKEVSLSGTVTQAIGAPSLLGSGFSFQTSQPPGGSSATMTLGPTTLDGFSIFATSEGFYDFDPLDTPGPGDLNLSFFILPPIDPATDDSGPGLTEWIYGGAFAEYGPREAESPEIELLLSVYLDAPLPTKFYEATDPDTGDVIDEFSFNYVEGPLSIDRITLGTVGGPAVPTIPLPASGLLLAGGLAGLAALRRRRSAIP